MEVANGLDTLEEPAVNMVLGDMESTHREAVKFLDRLMGLRIRVEGRRNYRT